MKKLHDVIRVQNLKHLFVVLIFFTIASNIQSRARYNPQILAENEQFMWSTINLSSNNLDDEDEFDYAPIIQSPASNSDNPDDIYWENKISPSSCSINGRVDVSIEYHGLLIVGGKFNVAGSSFVNNIAAWDGTSWRSLENKKNDMFYETVSAFAVNNDKLVVLGSIGKENGEEHYLVSIWDGSNWTKLQSSKDSLKFNLISAIKVYKGKIIISGSIIDTNGQIVHLVAVWKDSQWIIIGRASTGSRYSSTSVNALTVFQDNLIVGGEFNYIGGISTYNIAAWNGSTWSPIGKGILGDLSTKFKASVQSLFVYSNKLLVSGSFARAGGVSVTDNVVWDGRQWTSPKGWYNFIESDIVREPIIEWNDGLLVEETTKGPEGYLAINYLFWNGLTLKSLDLNKDISGQRAWGRIYKYFYKGSFVIFNSQLVISGDDTHSMSFWDGTNWIPLEKDGTKGRVNSTVVFDEMLIAGGTLKEIGGVKVNNIAAWNGLTWLPIGEELSMGKEVSALAVYNDKLIVAVFDPGLFEYSYLLSWDGNIWTEVESVSMNSKVEDMLVYGDKLIVAGGGNLFAEDPYKPSAIVSWDGSSWESLELRLFFWDRVFALEEYNNKLVAAGEFKYVDSIPSDDLIARDIVTLDGNSWSALDSELGTFYSRPSEIVYDLTVYHDQLIAAGIIKSASGDSVNNITAWNGSSWTSLGTGISKANSYLDGVRALQVFEDQLIVAGNFDSASGISANNIAAWNGNSWSSLGSGTSSVQGKYPPVSTLSVYKGNLIVGGNFAAAGNKVSASLAEWTKRNGKSKTVFGNPKLGLPQDFHLSQNYPNPFNPTTTIEFNLPKRSSVTIALYNVLGQEILELINQEYSAGNYSIQWDGKNNSGNSVASGIYCYRLETEDFSETKKMVLLK